MTDPAESALLAAVLASPDDDAPRLVYADWLEETGRDPARAEFIRLQCGPHAYSNRAKRLFLSHRMRWVKELSPGSGWCMKKEDRGDSFALMFSMDGHIQNAVFRRGFIAEFTCDLDLWRSRGPAIVRVAPVEVVRVLDRKPWNSANQRWGFSCHSADAEYDGDWWILPREIWLCLHGSSRPFNTTYRKWWKTEEAAHAALSAACLAWARDAAVVPGREAAGV